MWCPYTIYHEFQFRFGLSFVAYFLSWLIPRYKTPPDAKAVTSDNLTDCTALTKLSEICKKYANRQTKRDRDSERKRARGQPEIMREREASEIFGIWRDILIFRWHALGWTSDALGLACSYIWPVNQFWKSSFLFFSFLPSWFWFWVLFHVYPLPLFAVCNIILYIIVSR